MYLENDHLDLYKYAGRYRIRFLERLVDILCNGEQLKVEFPGMPSEYAILLIPEGENRFRIKGGPIHGDVAEVLLDTNNRVVGLRAGPYLLDREGEVPVERKQGVDVE